MIDRTLRCIAVAVAVLVGVPACAGQPISGIASVIDGDTIEVHGTRIRLHGVDAPESAQLCTLSTGEPWRCGQQAALALSDRLGRRTIIWDERGQDRYGRTIAVCMLDGENLNKWLVAQGWAVAYRVCVRRTPPNAGRRSLLRSGLSVTGTVGQW